MPYTGIGVAIGSIGLQIDPLTGDKLEALSVGGVTWLILSCAVALALGTYACVRISNVAPTKFGFVQSLVITSAFFAVMAIQATSILVPMASRSIGALGSAALALSQQPRVQAFFEDSLANLDLRGVDRADLTASIGSRLMMNDGESLRTLLAQHSNMSEAANGVGKVMAFSAWIIFAALLCGAVGAALGGTYASRMNIRKPALNWSRSQKSRS